MKPWWAAIRDWVEPAEHMAKRAAALREWAPDSTDGIFDD